MAFTAITNNLDWSAVSFINEFDGAIDERDRAKGGSGRSNTTAGTDVQAASFWATIQNWISGNCGSFVQSHNSSGSVLTDYDGETSIPSWTFANLMESASSGAAGSGQKNFRRATTIPTTWTSWTDAAYSYGPMQAGDIIGPWIFKDLQEAFKRLIWTMPSASWDSGTNNAFGGDPTGPSSSWAAAKSDAEGNTTWYSNSNSPGATSSGDLYCSDYAASFYAGKNKLSCSGLWTGKAHTADFYLWPEGYSYSYWVWDPNGTSFTEDAYSLMSSNAESSSASETSAFIGNTSQPNWCDEPIYSGPPENPPAASTGRGWKTNTEAIIVRWTGFGYV